MSIDVEALKARINLVEVVGSYVALKKRGSEYIGLCPFHSDSTPSFWVNPVKRFCHCFACDTHHDAISFIQALEGLDFKAACERLGAKDEWKPVAPVANEPAKPKPERVTRKPPSGAATPNMALRGLGEPSMIFPLRDVDGAILGYECRYAGEGGKKEVRMWTYGARGDASPTWGCGHFNAPRPLYGLERLTERPTAPVSIFEGPKKAEAGKRLLPPYACISWTGGANAWHKHDWKPVAGQKVLIWPDADKPGWEACEKLAALLSDPKGLACQVRVVDTNRMPEGWDVADAEADGWDTLKLIEWAKPRARDWFPPTPPPEPPKVSELPRKQQRPRLAVVGNTALEPTPDSEPAPASLSEDALADHFATHHGERWRYVKPWGSWFQWREDGWYRDDTGMVDHIAVGVTRAAIYWPEAASLTPDGKRKVNSKRTAGNLRDIAASDRRIAAAVDQWDTNHWLLGVPGGVVDLRTGAMADARPEDYITKRTRVAPEQGNAPIWRSFLNTVTANDVELVAFLQRFAGYALTGETREQCLAFLYGTGQNGKGVFITTIANILGDYAQTADADVFMESDQNRHSTEMARLRGARLVTVDETDSAKRWNEKRIKRITGGGKIEARFMRQDDFEYIPQFKLLIAGNHKPQLRGVGKAMQRRIHLVPFTVTIPDRERDDTLTEKLEAEYPQILQWMIDGCGIWRDAGLQAPEVVRDATSRYIESEDVIGEWLEERTEQAGSVDRPIAYKNYRSWVDGRGERPWSSKSFWAALEERGYTLKKSNGTMRIQGLQLRITAQDEPPSYPYQ